MLTCVSINVIRSEQSLKCVSDVIPNVYAVTNNNDFKIARFVRVHREYSHTTGVHILELFVFFKFASLCRFVEFHPLNHRFAGNAPEHEKTSINRFAFTRALFGIARIISFCKFKLNARIRTLRRLVS